MSNPKEEILLTQVKRKDPDALRIFMEQYALRAYGFFISLLGVRHEKALQGLFLESLPALLARIRPFAVEEADSFYVLLLGTLWARIKKEKKYKFPPEPPYKLDARLAILFDALACLDLNERLILLLRNQQELTCEEMARIVREPSEKVRAKLGAARIHFTETLQKIMSAQR